MTTAKPRNAEMFQFSTRDVDEDEPLTMLDINGVHIWLDGDGTPVIVDLPKNFTHINYVR